jgi:hypothetical protein
MGGRLTEIVAVVVTLDFAFAVAVKVTLWVAEIFVGAVYVTEKAVAAERVPHPAPEQPVCVKLHVTPAFVVSFATVAVNAYDWPASMDGVVLGAIWIVMELPLPPLQPVSTASPTNASEMATGWRNVPWVRRGFVLLDSRPVNKFAFARANQFEIVISILGILLEHAQAGASGAVEHSAKAAKRVE